MGCAENIPSVLTPLGALTLCRRSGAHQSLEYPHLERGVHTIDISLFVCEEVWLSSHASRDAFSGVDSSRVNFHHTDSLFLSPFYVFGWPYPCAIEVLRLVGCRRCLSHQPVSSIWHRSSFFSSSNVVVSPNFAVGTRQGDHRLRTCLTKQPSCSNWTIPKSPS